MCHTVRGTPARGTIGPDLTHIASRRTLAAEHATVGAFGIAAAVLVFLVNVGRSLRSGPRTGRDPWSSDTLEWSQTSPPPQAQFPMIPSVRSRNPMWDQAALAPKDERRARLLDDLHWSPLDWRGSLVVSVTEGEPEGVVHVPGPSIASFLMSVAFVWIFAAALLDNLPFLLVGGALTLVALVQWFRPQASERIALDEMPLEGSEDRLPLLVSGPRANGFWGPGVLVLILATALLTIVASYFYLGEGPGSGWPVRPLAVVPAAWGILLAALAGAGAIGWLVLPLDEPPRGRGRRAALAALLLASAAAAGLVVPAYGASETVAAESAYGSAVLALLGFQAVVSILVACMTLTALLWAVARPVDPRGDAVAVNTSLVAGFAALSSVVVLFIVYATPRLW